MTTDQTFHTFDEVVPPLSPKEAADEALRCYYCYDAPCIHGCPTAINIPVFIRQIAEGDLMAASRTILDANILGATCARICPTETLCEGACVRHQDSRAVSIGRLQRTATDYAVAHVPHASLASLLPRSSDSAAGRVAVIGSGPAGLGAAAALRRAGVQVEIFESQPELGGLDRYGIVSYREPNVVSIWESQLTEALGSVIHVNTRVGNDLPWEEAAARFDAMVIAVGLGHVPPMRIPGENLPGVWDALDMIAMTKSDMIADVRMGKRVLVIGAGNTAIDAATCAKRLGAHSVTILYRRGEDQMPAYTYEYAFAKADGIQFAWWVQPKEILGTDHVEGVRVVKTAPLGGDSSSRRIPVRELLGSESVMNADTVIRAIGQAADSSLWGNLHIDHEGVRPQVNTHTFESSRPGIYVVGDALAPAGDATVVNAVAQGKAAAAAIIERLQTTSPGASQKGAH